MPIKASKVEVTETLADVRVGVPYRHGQEFRAFDDLRVIDAEDFLLKFIHVDAGHRTSLHYHDQKDEIKFIVNADENHGSIIGNDGEPFPGVTVRNLPGVAHRATGPLDMIEVTSHHDDVTRIADDYGRA